MLLKLWDAYRLQGGAPLAPCSTATKAATERELLAATTVPLVPSAASKQELSHVQAAYFDHW